MDQIVLGLSKTAVEVTLIRVKAAIEEDEKVKATVQQDLEFITGEFQMMQSFLDVADGERAGNKVVSTWVGQVRDLAYDVEDCIEFIVHLDNKPWWRTLRLVWRLLPAICVPAGALPMDEAVANLRQLKGRVEAVAERNMRYRLIGDTGSKPAGPQPKPAVADAAAAALDPLVEPREDASQHSHAHAQSDDLQLAGLITGGEDGGEDDLQVISLWTTGGNPGMTSKIIRDAYDGRKIHERFGHRRAWVKLAHPSFNFNPVEFIRALVAQFGAHQPTHQGAVVVGEDFEELVKQVKEERYLVVLEDPVVELDAIRSCLQGSAKGSRIVVSTQQFEMASFCTGHPRRVVELKPLSPHHSIFAFFQFLEDKVKQPANDRMGKSILSGREDERHTFHNIVDWANNQQRHIVLSVTGVAGVGKSAIVRSVYDENWTGGYYDRYGWVDVSHPFNLRDFSRSLLLDLLGYSEHPMDKGTWDKICMMRIKDPIQECCRLLREDEQSCLVVIDGLRSTEEWESIRSALLPPHDKGVVVIVVTAEESVANSCADPIDALFHVRCLQSTTANGVFEQVLDTSDLTPDMHKEAQLILNKCGGLPKVIRAVGGYLKERQDIRVWKHLNDTFMHQLVTNPGLETVRDLMAWMHSYFRCCPDSVKPCIFYLSIFPRGHSVRRTRLVRRWIAEGYSREADSNVGKNWDLFFSGLQDLSVLTSTTKDRVLQVNSFFHEHIMSWPMEERFVFALEGHCSLSSQRGGGRHLAVGESWDRDEVVFRSIDFSRLRSLTVFGRWEKFFLVSGKMKLLRVLDLEDADGVTDGDVERIGRLLPRLKFLSLRGCRGVSRLPSSLGSLRQLQTLDVRRTSVATLPPAILKLQKLQFVRAGGNPSCTSSCCCTQRRRQRHGGGVALPRGIGKLTALHTLGDVDVSLAGEKTFMRELKSLSQLRKLVVSGVNWKNIQHLYTAISGHGHLESLSVSLHGMTDQGGSSSSDEDHQLPNLQNLKLYGLADKVPAWISKLDNLTKLNLQMTVLTQEVAYSLQQVPSLRVLRLFAGTCQGGMLDFVSCSRDCRVRVLEINCNSDLHVKFGDNGMIHDLEKLQVSCPGSKLELSGLSYLNSLKEVLLKCSNRDELDKDLNDQLGKRHRAKHQVVFEFK